MEGRKLSARCKLLDHFAKTGDPNGPVFRNGHDWTGSAEVCGVQHEAELVVRENQRGAFCDLYRETLKSAEPRPPCLEPSTRELTNGTNQF